MKPRTATAPASTAEAAFALRPFVFASVATLLAGYLDAVGYSYLAGLYLSFMSGNSTSLGVAIARLDGATAQAAATVVAAFVIGAVSGTLLAERAGGRAAATLLTAETALLALASTLTFRHEGFVSLLPAVMAMGLQNTMGGRVAGADIGKSFITGTLFGFGRGLGHALLGNGAWREPALFLASWLTFVSGAVAGALMLAALGLFRTVLASFALAALLTAAAWIGPWRGEGRAG